MNAEPDRRSSSRTWPVAGRSAARDVQGTRSRCLQTSIL